MKLLFVYLFLTVSISSVTAQIFNFGDAFSRLDRTIESSQEEFTKRDSYYLGRTVAAHILSRYPLYTGNPALTNYLNLICKALVINSPSPNWYNGYFVSILDTPEINAFSTPGGHIFITRGLIELASSEDMLAAIIAHELAHIQLQHGTADIMNARIVRQLVQERDRIFENIASQTPHQVFTESVSAVAETLFNRGYSQLQEFEADVKAVTLLVSAGYNAGSLIELLRILDRFQGDQIGNLNTTHPSPSQRIANLERQPARRPIVDTSSARQERFNRIMR